MTFEFELESYPIFQCKPKKGIIPAFSFHLVTFMFAPSESISYVAKAKCIMNESIKNIATLSMVGTGFSPQLRFESEGKIFFKPTQVGPTSVRKFRIENPSRIPTVFEFDSSKSENLIKFDPRMGILRGNEGFDLSVSFTPSKQKRYTAKIPCTISTLNSDAKRRKFILPLLIKAMFIHDLLPPCPPQMPFSKYQND